MRSMHGWSKTKLYSIWCSMIARCTRPSSKGFKYYGGRGITVCQEWASKFTAFRDWALANGYRESEASIDRIDRRLGYCPENCRWATAQLQTWNRGKTIFRQTKSRFIGVSFHNRCRKWVAVVCRRHFGAFRYELHAAFAYDLEVFLTRGTDGVVNFPERFVNATSDSLAAMSRQIESLKCKKPLLEAFGEAKTITAWAGDPRCVVEMACLFARLKGGMLPEVAMKTPKHEMLRKSP